MKKVIEEFQQLAPKGKEVRCKKCGTLWKLEGNEPATVTRQRSNAEQWDGIYLDVVVKCPSDGTEIKFEVRLQCLPKLEIERIFKEKVPIGLI